jgi:hypothetical protein
MQQFQEFMVRLFSSAIVGGILSPAVVIVIVIVAGTNGSDSIWRNSWILTSVVLFLTPWAKNTAKEWVEEMAQKELLRKAYEKEHAAWIRQEREKIADRKKLTAES